MPPTQCCKTPAYLWTARGIAISLLLVSFSLVPNALHAQARNPHIGLGLDVILGPPDNRATDSGFGLGFRARASFPISYDVSLAGSAGILGSFFRGRDDAAVTLNPQIGVIVTIPRTPWAPYFLAGFGGYIPLSDEVGGGPAIHAGVGWARLLTDASIYLEVNPSLIIGATATSFILPLRAGVIF